MAWERLSEEYQAADALPSRRPDELRRRKSSTALAGEEGCPGSALGVAGGATDSPSSARGQRGVFCLPRTGHRRSWLGPPSGGHTLPAPCLWPTVCIIRVLPYVINANRQLLFLF